MNPTRIVVDLPFPPSVNHYYMRTRFGMIIGAKGKLFRTEAITNCREQIDVLDCFAADAKLHVIVAAFPPDRRKRDLDNLGKCLCDALTHAGVYVDDSQIDWLEFRRKQVQKSYGRVIVVIEKIVED